ncbi:hypothetical protein D3C86_1009820 [compost metagenome]
MLPAAHEHRFPVLELGDQVELLSQAALAAARFAQEAQGRAGTRREAIREGGRLGLAAHEAAREQRHRRFFGVVAEVLQHLGGRLAAAQGILGHQAQDEGLERGVVAGGRGQRGLQVGLEQRAGVGLRVGGLARQQVVGHAAQGVQVGAAIDGPAAGDLGGHVAQGAPQGAARASRALHEPEVHQLDDARRAEADVLGLEIAVDVALGVDVTEGPAQGDEHLAHLLGGHGQQLVEALARHHLHGEVGGAVLQGAEVVDLDRVGVAQAGHGPELVLELLEGARTAGAQQLERHLAVVERVVDRQYLAHSPFPEGREDFVAIGDGVRHRVLH